ncbi:MAG TPA: lysophospholipid acyltransferase family protein [Stellaceae bacterium]|nr:lysophospholipid acyltransferase family protein [Stellaceae bacterium]
MSATLLRFARAFLYLAITLPLMPLQALFVALKSPLRRRLPLLYHRWTTRLLGFQIHLNGTPSPQRPTLFVANHVSFLDIEILGAVLETSFIAKAELARWPFFGWLAKLQRTVFVDRRVSSTHHQRSAIRERLDEADNLVLFPEGTTGDGNRALPFKSALFSVADYTGPHGPLIVQPVSIAYVRLDGMPLGRLDRPFVAWYGDMEFIPHLWTMLGLGRVGVEVAFHPSVRLADFGSRKALAEHCYRVVAAGVASAIAGRKQEWPTPAPAPAPAAVEPAGAAAQ